MEAVKIDASKLSDMVMCGDHPSFTKRELNMKEKQPDGREKLKERLSLPYSKISPTSSRTERVEREKEREKERERERSEHELRALDAERIARSFVLIQRPDVDIAVRRNRALVQAAVGSFRWPPYLVAVWVLVLLLTHLLHCLLNMLERALPTLKNVCGYFRSWTEESWNAEREGSARACPAGLGCLTGLLYALYFSLCGLHALVLWSVEPLLCSDERTEPKVTNYDEETTNTNTITTTSNA